MTQRENLGRTWSGEEVPRKYVSEGMSTWKSMFDRLDEFMCKASVKMIKEFI